MVCEGQMIVSFAGISARSMYHLPFSSPYTHTRHSWFVLERGHILFTSSTLKQLHLWVFPPLLCCFLSITSRNDENLSFLERKNSATRLVLFCLKRKLGLVLLLFASRFLPLSHFVCPILLFPICPVQIVGLSREAIPPCVNTS